MRLSLAALALVAATAMASAGRWRAYVVYGGSMAPTLPPGALAVVRPVAGPLRPGDVIAFRDGHRITIHRIVAPASVGAGPSWLTRGDANPVADARPVTARDVVGRVAFVIPWLGIPIHHLVAHASLAAPALTLAATGALLLPRRSPAAAARYGTRPRGRRLRRHAGRALPLVFTALAVATVSRLLPAAHSAAAFTAARASTGNRVATAASDLLFTVNLLAGPAPRPAAPHQPAATGYNRSLVLDAGSLPRPLPGPFGAVTTTVTALPKVIAIHGKMAAAISVQGVRASPRTVPWRDCTSYTPNWTEWPRGRHGLTAVQPPRAAITSGGKVPVSLEFRVSSASPAGVYCGRLVFSDATRPGRSVAVPLRFVVSPAAP